MKLISLVAFLILTKGIQFFAQAEFLINAAIESKLSMEGMMRLIRLSDPFQGNVAVGVNWGRVDLTYRVPGGEWLSINKYSISFGMNGDGAVSIMDRESGMPLVMKFPIEMDHLPIDFAWKQPRAGWQTGIFEGDLTTHHFIANNVSFIHFSRPSGKGSFSMIQSKKEPIGNMVRLHMTSIRFTRTHWSLEMIENEKGIYI